jgi:hypothetical protein
MTDMTTWLLKINWIKVKIYGVALHNLTSYCLWAGKGADKGLGTTWWVENLSMSQGRLFTNWLVDVTVSLGALSKNSWLVYTFWDNDLWVGKDVGVWFLGADCGLRVSALLIFIAQNKGVWKEKSILQLISWQRSRKLHKLSDGMSIGNYLAKWEAGCRGWILQKLCVCCC